jgi:hypothetical protein
MRKFILASVMVIGYAATTFAATSSPCGYKQPVRHEEKETGYRRDVLDFRVPVYTEKKGNINILQATKDRGKLLSGKE